MIIIYSLVLLSISTISFAMEKADQLPTTKRIPLTHAERAVFLNARKFVRNKPSSPVTPTAKQITALSNACKSTQNAHELLDISDKLQRQYQRASFNLHELDKMNPHLDTLGLYLLPFSCDWQQDSLPLFEKVQSLIPALRSALDKCDKDLDKEDPKSCNAAAVLLRHGLYTSLSELNSESEIYKDMLKKHFNAPSAQIMEPLVSASQIKAILSNIEPKNRLYFIEKVRHTIKDHCPLYIKINQAFVSMQTLLRTEKVFSIFDESKRFQIVAMLKRLAAEKTIEVSVPMVKDVTHLPLYNEEIHACNPVEIQNIRKTHPYSIQFRIHEPLISSDRECKSEILYFFSKGKLLNQHVLVDQIKPTTSFKFKTTATDQGFCVANKDLQVNMITESLWYIDKDYYFVDHTKGANLYKVDMVAALNLPQQKSAPAKIQP